MKPKAFMVLGTASNVGKSFIAAALCRLFSDWGYKTAPFKAQNMSNNSFVTADGGEIGRAQAVQAECARVAPNVHMNPVLLKPSQDNQSQMVLQGKAVGNYSAREYYARRDQVREAVEESWRKLAAEYEVIVMEGAGSPVEINLKQNDIVNMQAAEMADARCVLVADIDRGGVFASVIGTLELLEPYERARIDGILINKFRGDRTLFDDGVKFIEDKTGIKVWGVLPYNRDLWIDEEDAVSLTRPSAPADAGTLDIAVVLLPHLSNFTDFGILSQEPGVSLRYIEKVEDLGNPDLLILPGTKSTVGDYEYLVSKGFPQKIREYAEKGGRVLGICGGFQMMGKKIRDDIHVESSRSVIEALGFFDMVTEFQPEKTSRQVKEESSVSLFGKRLAGEIEAYEIHMGASRFNKVYLGFGAGGAVLPGQRIAGTYYHGLFDSAGFRRSFLSALAEDCGKISASGSSVSARDLKEKHYEALVKWFSGAVRMELLHERWNIRSRFGMINS